jgi:hypothetical protein
MTAPITHPDDVIGWAVGAGITVKLPMLGAGDSISGEVNYAEGAIRYAGSGIGTFAIVSGSTAGAGVATDAVVVAGSLQLTNAWSVVGGFQHVWNKSWKTSLYGTYGEISYGAPIVDSDWAFWQAGTRTVWTPVANLDLSVDIMYNELNSAFTTLGFTDQSWWQGIVRVQRNFWP